jgi:hypothetical protein
MKRTPPEPLRPKARDVDWRYVAEQLGCSRALAYQHLKACAGALGRDPETTKLLRVPERDWLRYHQEIIVRCRPITCFVESAKESRAVPGSRGATTPPESAGKSPPVAATSARRRRSTANSSGYTLPPVTQPRRRRSPRP